MVLSKDQDANFSSILAVSKRNEGNRRRDTFAGKGYSLTASLDNEGNMQGKDATKLLCYDKNAKGNSKTSLTLRRLQCRFLEIHLCYFSLLLFINEEKELCFVFWDLQVKKA